MPGVVVREEKPRDETRTRTVRAGANRQRVSADLKGDQLSGLGQGSSQAGACLLSHRSRRNSAERRRRTACQRRCKFSAREGKILHLTSGGSRIPTAA